MRVEDNNKTEAGAFEREGNDRIDRSKLCVVRGEVLTGSEDRDEQRQRKGPGTVGEGHP